MRRILLVAMLAVSTVQTLASEIDSGSLFLLGDGPTFEQLLSGKSDTAGDGLKQGRPFLNDVDSVFLGSRAAPVNALTHEVQSLLAQPSTEDRQIQSAQPDPGQNLSGASGNSTAGHASTGQVSIDDPTNEIASKGDLALSRGLNSNPNTHAKESGTLGSDGKGDLASPLIGYETFGFAAGALLLLWLAITAVVIGLHAEQKADRRRGSIASPSVLRMRSPSTMKPDRFDKPVLQARPDALPAHEWKMKDSTANANTNTEQGAAHAA